MDVDALVELERKAESVEWNKGSRREKFVLFSVNGYSKRLLEMAELRENLILV